MPDASSAEDQPGWRQRIAALWRAKLRLTAGLSVAFWVPYLFLSHHALRPVHTLPLTWLDEWAGFQPQPWTWVYESNFLITGIVPWLITTRTALRNYVMGFSLLAGVSFLIFVLFPVAAPRPANLDAHSILVLFARWDGPLNAFPSLHAGTLAYTLALGGRLFRGRRHPLIVAAMWLWAGLILFATLATKQHYAVDLLAGVLLGWAADWFAWRQAPGDKIAAANKRRKIGVESQSG